MITQSTFAEIGTPTNPFPGLRPFEFDESHLFFGRDGQSEQLISKLGRTRFLAVVGTSGSGKSSLVRAGLLPALLGGFMTSAGSDWRIAIMRPGSDPVGNLAEALNARDVFGSEIEENAEIQIAIAEATLRRGNLGLVEAVRQATMPGNENLLVVVDQFEEIFRFAGVSEGETYHNDAAAFIKLLLEASRQRETPVYVVLTMRSDYLGDCSQFWDLPEAINESQYLIPRLTRDQLREAIVGPAAVGLGKITARLANRLLNDVGDDQDQLPILQHALMRGWDEWKADRHDHKTPPDGDALDLCCYHSIGGMAEALSRHADEAFNELPDDRGREVAGCLFKCLTEKGSDNREIRRPTTLGEICAVVGTTEAEAIVVIETFRQPGRSFLMPPAGVELDSQSLIDISHESLIRVWERLRQWVAEEARSARQYQRLAETAMLHDKGEAGLWRDPDLQLTLNWRDQNRPNPAWARRYHPGLSSALAGLDNDQRQLEIEKSYSQAMQFLDDSEKQRAAEVDMRARQQQRELEQAQALAEEQKRRAEEAAKSASRLRRVVAVVVVLFLLALGAAGFALAQQSAAKAAERRALEQKEIAEAAERRALEQKDIADAATQDLLEKKAGLEKANIAAVNARQAAEEQAEIAKQQKLAAESARALEAEQRQLAVEQQRKAEANERLSRQFYYFANMNVAHKAFAEGNITRGHELLNAFLPNPDTSGAASTPRDAPSATRNPAPAMRRTPSTRPPSNDVRGFDWYHLWRLNHQEQDTLTVGKSTVLAVAYSPDGKTLATGSRDYTLKLWDVSTRRELATLAGHDAPVSTLAFSPDGKMLASGSFRTTSDPDGSVKLWDLNTRKEVKTLTAQGGGDVLSVAFSPDGQTLASGGLDHVVKLWNVRTGQATNVATHAHTVNAVAFSPDGETLASGSQDGVVNLWNKTTGKAVSLNRTFVAVNSLAFSPDRTTLAIGGMDTVIRLWDISKGVELAALEGQQGSVFSLAFSPDAKTLVSGGGPQTTLKLWDLSTRKEIATLTGHADSVSSVAFSPDGKTLASASRDKTVKLWDVNTRQQPDPPELGAPIYSVAFSPDGKTMATGSGDNNVNIWDFGTRRVSASLAEHSDYVLSVAFSPDGKTMASGSRDKTVKVWDVGSRRVVATLKGHEDYVSSVAFSRDGKMLASGSGDGTVRLWDIVAWKRVATLTFHSGLITSVAFSPDGKVLASASNDSELGLWDVSTDTPNLLEMLETPNGEYATSLTFSPDGKTLAAGCWDKTIRLWDISTRQVVGVLTGHQRSVTTVALSPDGKTLASSSGNTVKLWDVSTRQEVATLKAQGNSVTSLAFSPDSKALAAAGLRFDGTIRKGNLTLFLAATDAAVTRQKSN